MQYFLIIGSFIISIIGALVSFLNDEKDIRRNSAVISIVFLIACILAFLMSRESYILNQFLDNVKNVKINMENFFKFLTHSAIILG
jgi:predicted PurR-regulated permease PerM